MKPSTQWWRYLAPLAVIAIIALIPVPAGLESHTWLYFAVFTGVIVGLILEPVPGAVVAMVGISIIAILSPWLLFSPEQLAQPGFKFTAKSLSWAVSGFSNSVIWLIFAAFMFGTGYEKTGLGTPHCADSGEKDGTSHAVSRLCGDVLQLILAPVTPSNSARGAGIIYPIIRKPATALSITTKRQQFAQHWLVHHVDGDCCRLRDQRHFLDGDGTKLAVNWTDEKRISRHAELGRLVPRDVAAQHFTGSAGSLDGLRAVPTGTVVW